MIRNLKKFIQLAIIKDGTFYIVGTTSGNNYYLRISLMNTRTTLDDLKLLIKIAKYGAAVLGGRKNCDDLSM